MSKGRCSQIGNVLLDWSTTLSLAGTVAMVAVPGLRTFVHESQRSAVVNELQLEVRRAARVANELGQSVTLCAAASESGCSGDGDWSRGWVAFVDADGDGTMGAHETHLELWRTRNGHANITVSAEPGFLTFRPFYARPFTADGAGGRLTVCDRERHGGARAIEILRGGVPQLVPAAVTSCA